jgi:hypothetical protein
LVVDIPAASVMMRVKNGLQGKTLSHWRYVSVSDHFSASLSMTCQKDRHQLLFPT